jgi:hypothetical protein
MPRVRNKQRSARRKRLREKLFALLGGRCSIHASDSCGPHLKAEDFEVHHVDGCTWNQRAVNAETRLYRYLRELREGVRLAAACRSCNAALNQSVYGTRAEAEVPF